MLVVRVDEATVEDAPFPELLRSNGCEAAEEAARAFYSRGTTVERIAGVAQLIRLDRSETNEAVPGEAGSRERRERDELTPELAATSLVFLPAIPSWLPLWSLLSPEDAVSSADGLSPLSPSSHAPGKEAAAEAASALPETGSPTNEVEGVFTGFGSGPVEERKGGDGCGKGKPEAGDVGGCEGLDGFTSPGQGTGGGAVRLLQVVAAAQTSYRYAAILHFWAATDAASFVAKFNGMALPDRGVLKALFLCGLKIVRSDGVNVGEGAYGVEASSQRRRRRSLSEGAALGASAARQAGCEEFKSNWPGGIREGSSCSPARERTRLDSSRPFPSPLGRVRADVSDAAGVATTRHTSPGPLSPSLGSRGTRAAEEYKGGGGGIDGTAGSASPTPRLRDSGTPERKGGDGRGGSRSPPNPPWQGSPLKFTALAGAGRRRPRPSLAWGKNTVVGGEKEGGGDRGGGIGHRAGAILPPCPVCLDRLEPSVSGVPSARLRAGRALRGWGARCNHRGCDGDGKFGKITPEQRGVETRGQGEEKHDVAGEKMGRGFEDSLSAGGGRLGWEGARERKWDGWDDRSEEREKGKGAPALNLAMWKGSNCRVCRSLNVAVEGAPDVLYCETCRIAHNLWVCMVCGHIGCGRYTEEHANRHFRLSGHTYSLELSTGRVWNYTGDCYAHRALRGHLGPSLDRGSFRQGDGGQHGWTGGGVSGREGGAAAGGGGIGGGARQSSPPLYSEGVFDEQGQADTLKVAVVSREYEALVARQLQEQQRYFEGLIATAVAGEAEANAPADEGLGEEERLEVARLRHEVDELTHKYGGLLETLREDEEAARRVRSENRALVSEQRDQKQAVGRLKQEAMDTKRLCERQMAELEGQMQDLLFFLKAQQEVKSNPQREELVGGSVVMGEGNAAAATAGRGSAKETERERLARRLKERSHSSRRGSNMHR